MRVPPPGGPNSFNFMQFLGNFDEIVCWRPLPGELAPPPRGNPRSATGNIVLNNLQNTLDSWHVWLARISINATNVKNDAARKNADVHSEWLS